MPKFIRADATYKATVTSLRSTLNEIIEARGEQAFRWRIESVRAGLTSPRGFKEGYLLLHDGKPVFPTPMQAPKLYPLMRKMLAFPPTPPATKPPAAPEPEYMPPNKGRKGRKPDSLLNQPDA